jgi:hypothetical protein
MRTRFKQSGYYTVLTDNKYTKQTDYLKPGDILVREGHHTIMVLENGSAITDDDEEVVEPVVPEEPEDPAVPGVITTLVKITARSAELSIDKIENTKAAINIKIVEQKTGAVAKIMSADKVGKYTWTYQLENLSNNTKITKDLLISSGTYKLDLANLIKGTTYALQVFAVKNGKPAFCSQKILFTTNTEIAENEPEKQKFAGDPTNVIKQIYIKVNNKYQPAIIYKM